MKLGEREGLTYINGYDHPNVIAGAGTLGMEILEQVGAAGRHRRGSACVRRYIAPHSAPAGRR